MSLSFNEQRFQRTIDEALLVVARVLDVNRAPVLADKVPHTYTDKYVLTNFVTRGALAALMNTLYAMGFQRTDIQRLIEWSSSQSVTLAFDSEERCVFDHETTRDEESPTTSVTEVTGGLFGSHKVERKVVTRVTEYFYKYTHTYKLTAYAGADSSNSGNVLTVAARSAHTMIKTAVKNPPRKEVNIERAKQVNVTWLLQQLDAQDNLVCKFDIDRGNAKTTHTPRRNKQVDDAARFFSAIASWVAEVGQVLKRAYSAQQEHNLNIASITATNDIFLPILPLFEAPREDPDGDEKMGDEHGGSGVVMSSADVNVLLAEHEQSLLRKLTTLQREFPSASEQNGVITQAEAVLHCCLTHVGELEVAWSDAVGYVEKMLERQVIAAVGKVLQPSDFNDYMVFHGRKLFKPQYAPEPFCYAVRRPNHYPDGVVSIESRSGGESAQPIFTCARHMYNGAEHPIKFTLNAATTVRMHGERHLHGYIGHQFSGQAPPQVQLVARARQFSSFMLLVGRMSAADTFEPKDAIIIQNKEELVIPLMLEHIPTPKQFRDAIESLSPEQQRFCKAFRQLQLESTVFAVCVVQIKPQLEKLLKIPDDSLTKEIRLTQDLLELFIKYQIPSDLLTYEGDVDAPMADKVTTVRGYVEGMMSMLKDVKKDQVREQEMRQRMAEAQMSPPRMMMMEDSFGGFGGPPPAPSAAMSFGAPMHMAKSSAAAPRRMMRSSQAAVPMMAAASIAPPPPVAAPRPQPSATAVVAPKPQTQQPPPPVVTDTAVSVGGGVDFTQLPAQLDKAFEKLDDDNAVRATIITTGPQWEHAYYASLLSSKTDETMYEDDQKSKRNEAFDLLDALSRSGALSFDEASLHVIITATHCFDKSLLDTVVQSNINPIEKVERSMLINATAVHGVSAAQLVSDAQLERVQQYSAKLFIDQE